MRRSLVVLVWMVWVVTGVSKYTKNNCVCLRWWYYRRFCKLMDAATAWRWCILLLFIKLFSEFENQWTFMNNAWSKRSQAPGHYITRLTASMKCNLICDQSSLSWRRRMARSIPRANLIPPTFSVSTDSFN